MWCNGDKCLMVNILFYFVFYLYADKKKVLNSVWMRTFFVYKV